MNFCTTWVRVLTNKSLDEESYGDHVKNKEVEYILPVLFEEGRYSVPLLTRPALRILRRQLIDMKAGHASDIRRRVEEILLGAFTIETDRDEVALVLLHHQFEVVVREIILPLESGVLINKKFSSYRDSNGRYFGRQGNIGNP